MSRSYKKSPVVKDKCKFSHNYCNRMVRHQVIDLDEIAPRQKRLYRKYTPVYDITDYVSRYDSLYDHIVKLSWYLRK